MDVVRSSVLYVCIVFKITDVLQVVANANAPKVRTSKMGGRFGEELAKAAWGTRYKDCSHEI